MTWLDGFSDIKAARARAETAFYAPLGMMSPLWIAFGAAASAGAAFWLMSRLANPVNIEAATALATAPTPAPEADEAASFGNADVAIEDVADDLTRLAGVGPKIAKALAERGVERFAQLAAWTEQDLAAFDAALDLRGKAVRAGFVAQARTMLAAQA